jgi:putative zinc- or iron-chelating protein
MCSSRPRATQFTIPAMSEFLAPAPLRSSGKSPLDAPAIEAVWRAAAAAIGFSIARTRDAYATSDGRGTIAIGADEVLDADDAFAQLVFHELCHAITEGEGAVATPDWGLDNVAEDKVREHACLRFGAHLAERFGLRAAMAPTTDYRAYYDALGADPLAGEGDPATPIAIATRVRFEASTWRAPMEEALARTAVLAEARHPLGFPWGPAAETCGSCAWLYVGGRGAPVARCRQAAPPVGDGARTAPGHRACGRWEPPVDCQRCGACCREAYHSVTVSVRDPVVWKEPALIVREGHRFEIRREKERCAALEVGPPGATPRYACRIYDNRPNPCREFAAGGRHCLDARRRVGLSVKAA